MSNLKLTWRVNHEIRAPRLRVIGADSKQIGILTKTQALSKAREAQLDLVEVAPNADPPVAKIVNFSKFRYQEEKKLKAENKKVKGGELKEIRFSPFIADNDYNTRLARVKEFLSGKNKVRVVVVFLGRQMGSKQFGYDLLKRILQDLGDNVKVDMEPKFMGRHLSMVVSPTNKKVENKNEQTKNS